MEHGASLCVTCAWRQTCNKKFLVDGATTTRCAQYTRDITLEKPGSQRHGTKDEEGRNR
jgi:hypothetical protein